MRFSHILLVVAVLVSGTLAFAWDEEPVVTRVLYLQEMEANEALTLLRVELQVRAIITLPGRNALVVSDSTGRVEHSEALLRGRDTGLVTADPHEPLDLSGIRDLPLVPGSFRIVEGQTGIATDLLRALFQVREVSEPDGDGVIAVQAPEIILGAGEAVLSELGLLAGS